MKYPKALKEIRKVFRVDEEADVFAWEPKPEKLTKVVEQTLDLTLTRDETAIRLQKLVNRGYEMVDAKVVKLNSDGKKYGLSVWQRRGTKVRYEPVFTFGWSQERIDALLAERDFTQYVYQVRIYHEIGFDGTCKRCGGKRIFAQYTHVKNGVCFDCMGSGYALPK